MIDIANCSRPTRCTQRWDYMERVVGTADMRFCLNCQTVVHGVRDEADFKRLAQLGKCVALFHGDPALLPCGL
ncbi:MAG TPA: hypothetical protein VFN09_05915 [Rhodanobacteraceae bacterium]|nr:hypothetical protein [Rhodanobacteraceae bacterium]